MPALFLTALAAQIAAPAPTAPAPAAPVQPGAADRAFGHFRYAEATAATLVSAPDGFAAGQRCLVQPAMLPDLTRMLAAAGAAGIGLRGVSCYRSYAHQHATFCRPGKHCEDPEQRAHVSAPPGYSEHATGYAIDFAERPQRGCADVAPCFGDTAAGRWLAANGPSYGFELSFPDANAQGVAHEAWHWRWVGATAAEPGAGTARAIFARARIAYPARPAVPALLAHIAEQPPVPGP